MWELDGHHADNKSLWMSELKTTSGTRPVSRRQIKRLQDPNKGIHRSTHFRCGLGWKWKRKNPLDTGARKNNEQRCYFEKTKSVSIQVTTYTQGLGIFIIFDNNFRIAKNQWLLCCLKHHHWTMGVMVIGGQGTQFTCHLSSSILKSPREVISKPDRHYYASSGDLGFEAGCSDGMGLWDFP